MTTALAIPGIEAGLPTKFCEATACQLARTYAANIALIRSNIEQLKQCTKNLREAFGEHDSRYHFDINLSYQHGRTSSEDGIYDGMKRAAWRILSNKLGLRNVMSVKRRKEFDEQLERGELPEITEETIVTVLLGLIGQAKEFAKEAAKEVFDILRPRGWSSKYKTNNVFKIGKRVILAYAVERGWSDTNGFRASYHKEQELIAIDGVFHLMDGKGIMREDRGPLVKAISEAKEGKGETPYFSFKCFKNRNLHIQFKRLDLVKQLNGLAVGEFVLGEDQE